MIPVDAILALTGVLVPHDAERLLLRLAGPLAAHAAREASALAKRPRTERAAALARTIQAASGSSRRTNGRGPLVDRLWRDSTSWSRARVAGAHPSARSHTLLRPPREGAPRATGTGGQP